MDETDVRRLVLRFLLSEATLAEFVWDLRTEAWNAQSPTAVLALVNQILLRVDEYSASACDEEQFMAALRPFCRPAIDNMTLGERDVFVKMLAKAALSKSVHEQEPPPDPAVEPPAPRTKTS